MREIETVLVARASSGGSEESRASDRVLVWGGGAEFYREFSEKSKLSCLFSDLIKNKFVFLGLKEF